MNPLISRDLVQAAKKHINFLEEMHKTGISLRTPMQSWKSFHRYVDFWLPLVRRHPNLDLIPPADVAWLWHCHRLAPQAYEKFMQKEYDGVVLEATIPFSFQTPTSYSRTELITQSLWKEHYPLEPFFHQPEELILEQAPSSPKKQDQYTKASLQEGRKRLADFCVFASAQSQRALLWQISEPWYKEDEFLRDGVERYHQFLQLAKVMDRSVPLVPTFQIDLLWHTHILASVQQYRQDCLQICGRPFSHDDSFNDRSEGGSLEIAFHKTCDLWKQQYSTNYIVEGAMYRGEPPQEYFDEYETWDGSEWGVEWEEPSLWRELLGRAVAAKERLHPGRLLEKKKSKKRSKKSKTKPITWNDLLQATGTDCWDLRKQALDNGDDCVVVPVNHQRTGFLGRKRPQDSVQVLGSLGLFQQLEAEGMDKRQMPDNMPKSLTQEIGTEWERQRELVAKKALARVKEMSLQSVDQVSWDDLLKRDLTSSKQPESGANKVVDLKTVVVEACLDWMMRLFAGSSYEFLTPEAGYAPLAKAFLDFWNEIRARRKSKARLGATQGLLVDKIIFALVPTKFKKTARGGILHHIFQQKELTNQQAAMNCVNAMVAAFDATVVVVFWTLWNLSRTEGAWDKCRNELLAMMQQNDSAQDDIDELEQLAAFKKAATEGQSYDCSSLSYLSRAMAETIRVFPPVWTLPRVDPKSQKGKEPSFVQLDVAWTNRALDRDWNPDRESWEGNTLASFGAGKRHCPGGTAALFAARRLLRKFVVKFETAPLECEQEHAIRSVYLGPTLCVEGPQYFELQLERKDQNRNQGNSSE